METWTINRLLNWITEYLGQKGVDSPRLQAELLLCHVLSLQRIELYTQFDRPVEPDQLAVLRGLVKRASEHEPIAYLVERCEFYSLSLKVTPACLIPRPETELLVERAIELLRGRPDRQYVLDLCTGCGPIAAAIAKNLPDCRVVATDLSDDALQVAAENIKKYKLEERVKLLAGDLYDPIIKGLGPAQFDLIVSNPPYVSAPEMEKLDRNVKDYEPRQALYGGADGLDIYRRIIADGGEFLTPDGAIMLEIGYAQGPAVRELLEQTGLFREVTIRRDLSKNDRIAIAVR